MGSYTKEELLEIKETAAKNIPLIRLDAPYSIGGEEAVALYRLIERLSETALDLMVQDTEE